MLSALAVEGPVGLLSCGNGYQASRVLGIYNKVHFDMLLEFHCDICVCSALCIV